MGLPLAVGVARTDVFLFFCLFLPESKSCTAVTFFSAYSKHYHPIPSSEKCPVWLARRGFRSNFRDAISHNTTHHPCDTHRLFTRSTRDVFAPPAHPANVYSLPNSRRWQDFAALAEAHILCTQLWGSVCRSLEDGQDGTVAGNRGGLDVLPGAETRHRAVGSSIMMLGVEGASLGSHDSLGVGFHPRKNLLQ